MIAAIRDLGCTDLSYQFSGYNDETCKYFVGELAKFPKTEVAYFMIEGKKVDLKKGMQYDLTGRPFPKVQFPIKKFLTNWASEGGSAGMDCHRCEVSLAAFLSLQALARAKESTPRGKLLVIEDGGVWGPIANATAFEKSNSIADYRIKTNCPEDVDTDKMLANKFFGKHLGLGEMFTGILLGSVEHGTDGLYALGHVSDKIIAPVFTTAISQLRTTVAPRSAAASVLAAIESVLASQGALLSTRTSVVFGSRGALGRQIVRSLHHRKAATLDGERIEQVYGVDMLVGKTAPEDSKIEDWAPNPYSPGLGDEFLGESKRFSEISIVPRRNIDLVIGVSGGASLMNDTDGKEVVFDTLTKADMDEWLVCGKKERLWIASGSVKTREFEAVKMWVAEKVQEAQAKGASYCTVKSPDDQKSHLYEVFVRPLIDTQSDRQLGEVIEFVGFDSNPSGLKRRVLVSICDWKPANFSFFGIPTETAEKVISQLVECATELAVAKELGPPQIHAVDYSVRATNALVSRRAFIDDDSTFPLKNWYRAQSMARSPMDPVRAPYGNPVAF